VAELPAASDGGVNAAVNPEGNPEAEKVTAAGKVVPPDGLIGNVYVAVPPGATVCVVVPPVAERVKSSTVTATTALLMELKFPSPP
jgi:hypothetical protein